MDTHETRQSLASPAARALFVCLSLLEQRIHLTSKRCQAGFFAGFYTYANQPKLKLWRMEGNDTHHDNSGSRHVEKR